MEIKKPILQKRDLKNKENFEVSSVIDFDTVTANDVSFEDSDVKEISIIASVIESMRCSSLVLDDVLVRDSVVTKCDFSGVVSNATTLERVEIHSSRIQGTQFMDAVIKDVLIRSCKGEGSSFRFSKLKNVAFVECDMRSSDFQGAELENVIFENCDLSGAGLYRTKLSIVDIRTSKIDDIQIDKESIKKVIVSAEQALYIAPVFGLSIEG